MKFTLTAWYSLHKVLRLRCTVRICKIYSRLGVKVVESTGHGFQSRSRQEASGLKPDRMQFWVAAFCAPDAWDGRAWQRALVYWLVACCYRTLSLFSNLLYIVPAACCNTVSRRHVKCVCVCALQTKSRVHLYLQTNVYRVYLTMWLCLYLKRLWSGYVVDRNEYRWVSHIVVSHNVRIYSHKR